ncbi:MAG: hypothetical protein QE485_17055 [Acidovorax sp.]|nr:hypothetical protein [Acidovorax sp.]MDH4418921.1 hypothetical protein [Acidovorax sp.]
MNRIQNFFFQVAGCVIVVLMEASQRIRGKWRRSGLRARLFGSKP